MNNYIDYITKKCHEANPKLLELTVRCEKEATNSTLTDLEYFLESLN